MMKHIAPFAALAALLLAGCYPTRIVTSVPEVSTDYTTVVTIPRTKTTTTTTQVYARSYDISLQLDLQAVAAAFAQSSSVKEFESLINNASYIISNLDLNGDGYVDYLRVLETIEGRDHVFLIQAVLSPTVFQDVATIVVENPGYYDYCLEIVGAPFIYGPSYILRPVFLKRPPILPILCRTGYERWRSPWYWDHFPSYYKRPAPVYLNHYQAYIDTYMGNHEYCHEVSYPSQPHYQNYSRVCQSDQRNDYEKQHPESSFTVRNANVAVSGTSRTVSNARDVKANNAATKTTSTTTTASRSSSTTRSSSTASTKSGSTTSASRSSSTSGSTASASRSSSTSGSTASSSRSGSTTGASRSSSTGSSASSGTKSSGSTTVSSRVRNSGSTDTRTTTVTKSGGTTTVKRGSTSSSSTSASRSSSSGGTSSSSTTSATRGTRR